jgi:hypothetical protein
MLQIVLCPLCSVCIDNYVEQGRAALALSSVLTLCSWGSSRGPTLCRAAAASCRRCASGAPASSRSKRQPVVDHGTGGC